MILFPTQPILGNAESGGLDIQREAQQDKNRNKKRSKNHASFPKHLHMHTKKHLWEP